MRQIDLHAAEEARENLSGGARDKHEHQQSDRKDHVDPGQKLNALGQAGDRRNRIDPDKRQDSDGLSREVVGNTRQRIQPVGHLQPEKADRPDGAGNHSDDTGRIGNQTNRAVQRTISKQWVEQGARCQRQALVIVVVHQHHGRQRAEDRPGQKAPVQKALRQEPHLRAPGVSSDRSPKTGGVDRKCAIGSPAAQNTPPPASRVHMIMAPQLNILNSGVASPPITVLLPGRTHRSRPIRNVASKRTCQYSPK